MGLCRRRWLSVQRLRLHAESRPRRTEVFSEGLPPGSACRRLRRLQRRRCGQRDHARRMLGAPETEGDRGGEGCSRDRAGSDRDGACSLCGGEAEPRMLPSRSGWTCVRSSRRRCWRNCGRSFSAGRNSCCPSTPWPRRWTTLWANGRSWTCSAPMARCPSTTTSSEREMKRVVLNRKNSLFVGNPRGGRTAAILASLTSTCRRHDIDPQLYLTQLLTNLSQVRKSELPNWLPDQWKRLQAARLPRSTCTSHTAHAYRGPLPTLNYLSARNGEITQLVTAGWLVTPPNQSMERAALGSRVGHFMAYLYRSKNCLAFWRQNGGPSTRGTHCWRLQNRGRHISVEPREQRPPGKHWLRLAGETVIWQFGHWWRISMKQMLTLPLPQPNVYAKEFRHRNEFLPIPIKQ